MPDVTVCGAGIIGLTTAIRLQELGASVLLVTRDMPTQTTSAVAAAIWYPFLAEPKEAVLRWSTTTYQKLCELAARPATGVHMQEVVERQNDTDAMPWWASATPRIVRVPAEELPDGTVAAIRTAVPVCDTRRHLPWLLDEFLRAGGNVIERELESLEEAFGLSPRVVNCTGLGAAKLCDDQQMQPVRGQVVIIESAKVAEAPIDDTGPDPIYVVPRGEECVLGGTTQHDDTRLTIDEDDTAHILAQCRARVPALANAPIREVKVGLRPYRKAVRLQAETRPRGQLLVHNYGHGGSGFTLSWGCADDAARQILELPPSTH